MSLARFVFLAFWGLLLAHRNFLLVKGGMVSEFTRSDSHPLPLDACGLEATPPIQKFVGDSAPSSVRDRQTSSLEVLSIHSWDSHGPSIQTTF